MIPPRHQPTSWTGRPPASSLTRADRAGQDVADPVLEPEVLVGERDVAVLDEVGRVADRDEVLGHRAAAAQVEADRRRGERRDEQHRQVVLGVRSLGGR